MLNEAWVVTEEGEIIEDQKAIDYNFSEDRIIVIDYNIDFAKIDTILGESAQEGLKVWSEEISNYEWLFSSTFNKEEVNISLYPVNNSCSKIQLIALSTNQMKKWQEYKQENNFKFKCQIEKYIHFAASKTPLLFRDQNPRRALNMREYSLQSQQLVVYPAHAIYWMQQNNK